MLQELLDDDEDDLDDDGSADSLVPVRWEGKAPHTAFEPIDVLKGSDEPDSNERQAADKAIADADAALTESLFQTILKAAKQTTRAKH